MQLIRTERQVGHKKHIGTWKLLQAVHQELLCNNKALVLAYPDPDAPYVMDTDASYRCCTLTGTGR